MNPLEKACALMEAAGDADLARLCGAERLMLQRQLLRWDRALARTQSPPGPAVIAAPTAAVPAGVLRDLHMGLRSE